MLLAPAAPPVVGRSFSPRGGGRKTSEGRRVERRLPQTPREGARPRPFSLGTGAPVRVAPRPHEASLGTKTCVVARPHVRAAGTHAPGSVLAATTRHGGHTSRNGGARAGRDRLRGVRLGALCPEGAGRLAAALAAGVVELLRLSASALPVGWPPPLKEGEWCVRRVRTGQAPPTRDTVLVAACGVPRCGSDGPHEAVLVAMRRSCRASSRRLNRSNCPG